MYKYVAKFIPADEGGFVITVPDIPEVVTQAETLDEGIEMAADAIELVLSAYIRERKLIPRPRAARGRHNVRISVSTQAEMKLALYEAMREEGLRKADLARKLKVQPSLIDRLLDLQHQSQLKQLEDAFNALGRTVEITVKQRNPPTVAA